MSRSGAIVAHPPDTNYRGRGKISTVAGKDQNSDGSTASPRASNVVRLRPRQWLESEDELVPIGKQATQPRADRYPTKRLVPPQPPPSGDRKGPTSSEEPSTPRHRASHASTWLGTGEETVFSGVLGNFRFAFRGFGASATLGIFSVGSEFGVRDRHRFGLQVVK